MMTKGGCTGKHGRRSGSALSEGLGITAPPLRASEFVQAMWPECVALWYSRMLKVRFGVLHADSSHNCDGRGVEQGREGHHFFKVELLEAQAQTCLGALCGEAVTPCRAFEPPADLDTRAERQLAAWDVQAYEAYELTSFNELDCPVSPAVLCEVGKPSVDAGIRLLGGLQSREVPHDYRVAVHRGEGWAMDVPPDTERQAWRVELDWGSAHGCLVWAVSSLKCNDEEFVEP
jgi:hypothetical protein